MKRNYQKELEETLQKLQAEGKRPTEVNCIPSNL